MNKTPPLIPTNQVRYPTVEDRRNAKTVFISIPFSLENPFGEIYNHFYRDKKLGRANATTYNQYIKDAGDANQFDEAKQAFYEAKVLGLADVTTYSHYIESAILAGQREEVEKAFANAEESGLVNDEIRGKVFRFINQ